MYICARLPSMFVLLSALFSLLAAQTHSIETPLTFSHMTQKSGYIFSGSVVSVVHLEPASPGQVGVMEITFRVQQGLRGARDGEFLKIREWEGLWRAGEQYRVGSHVLLLLYPASKLGLTSPVAGAVGRFDLAPDGSVLLRAHQRELLPPEYQNSTGPLSAGRLSASSLVELMQAAGKD